MQDKHLFPRKLLLSRLLENEIDHVKHNKKSFYCIIKKKVFIYFIICL